MYMVCNDMVNVITKLSLDSLRLHWYIGLSCMPAWTYASNLRHMASN